MNTLKHIWLTLVQLAKQVWALPQTLANVTENKRRQLVRDENEAERLDRIRNPSKYQGK